MFTPDNEKLKSIVFHLLKKPAFNKYQDVSEDDCLYWTFALNSDNPFKKCIGVTWPNFQKEENNWQMRIFVDDYYRVMQTIKLSEKEAMEIKWQLDDIADSLDEKLWNDVANFALEETGTQDELLDD